MQARPLQAGPRANSEQQPEHALAAAPRQALAAESTHPVAFRCYGAGVQRDRQDQNLTAFTFRVDHGRSIQVLADREVACAFIETAVVAFGGWEAVKARHLKRGNRRHHSLSGPAASASAGEKENHWHGHKAPIATPTAAPEVSR